MKKRIFLLLAAILITLIALPGCSGPISDSEVSGDYGAFELDDSGVVELEGDRGKYVSSSWEITDAENGIVTFKYEITDDNIECYDEDFWTEYHEEGFENPEDALEEHFEEIIEGYDVPPEGDYKYDRSEEKLVSVDYDTEYYKKD